MTGGNLNVVPRFQLQRVDADGTRSVPELCSVLQVESNWHMRRRGFFITSGVGVTAAAALAACGGGGGAASAPPAAGPSPAPPPASAPSPGPAEVNAELCPAPVSKLAAHVLGVAGLAVSPDSRWLATTGDGALKLWSLPAATLDRVIPGSGRDTFNRWVGPVAFSRDGSAVATAGEDAVLLGGLHWISIWNPNSGSLVRSMSGHDAAIESLAFSSNDVHLVSGSRDETVRIWDFKAGALLRTIAVGGAATAVATSPDGRRIACSSIVPADQTVKVFDMDSGALQLTLRGHDAGVSSVAFSPDGSLLASASVDRSIRLWNAQSGALMFTLAAHSGFVNAVAFSPDGQLLASGSRDGTVRIWRVVTGQLVRTLAGPESLIDVVHVAFDPANRWLASGTVGIMSQGGAVALWDLASSRLMTCLTDLATAARTSSFTTYSVSSSSGVPVVATAPAGVTLPQGAICTCNAVFGTGTGSRGSGGDGGSCTCNTVCTCVPVCQAHRLLHDNSTVRQMAVELLLHMGAAEMDYIRWAEAHAQSDLLRDTIASVRRRVQAGESASVDRWPSAADCVEFLDDADEVVALMAAQMLQLHSWQGGLVLHEPVARSVHARLASATKLHWRRHLL